MKKTAKKFVACLVTLALVLSMAIPFAVSAAEIVDSMAGEVREYLTGTETAFNGSTMIEHNDDAPVLALANSARVTYSFKAAAAPTLGTMVALGDPSSTTKYITFFLQSGNTVGIEIRNSASTIVKTSVPADVCANIFDNQWHTVEIEIMKDEYYSFTFDGKEILNQKSDTTLFANNLGINITQLSIGGFKRGGSGTWFFTGSMKDVKIENLSSAPVVPVAQYYNGSTVTASEASTLAALTKGSITTAFKLDTAGEEDVALFTLGSDKLTVNPKTGDIKLGSTTVKGSAERIANTTQWHTLIALCDGSEVTFILDGTELDSVAHSGLFADSSASAGAVGENISCVIIYNEVINEKKIKTFVGETSSSIIKEGYYNFTRQTLMAMGDAKSNNYRIPALVQAGDITIAAADERKFNNSDYGAIDLQVRISYDNGETWSEQTTISEFGKPVGYSVSSAQPLHIDPCLAYDEVNDVVYLAVDMFPESFAATQMNLIQDGSGFFEATLDDGTTVTMQALNTVKNGGTRYGLIQDRDEHGTVLESATVYAPNSNGTYSVSKTYFVSDYSYGQLMKDPNNNGNYTQNAGNIFVYTTANKGELTVTCTMYAWLYTSHDRGKTWDNPVNITSCKQSWMRFFGVAPGSGIVISGGEHDGRIIFPCYFTNNASSAISSQSSAALYSDDGGLTWNIGKSVNEIRFTSENDIKTFQGGNQTTENSITQVSEDGALRIYCRNQNGYKTVVSAMSYDGGENWVAPDTADTTILESKLTSAADALALAQSDDKKAALTAAISMADVVIDNAKRGAASVSDVGNALKTIKAAIALEDVTYTLGNVNGDDFINAADAVLILQYFSGIIDNESEGFIIEAANVNGDDFINAADAVLVLQSFAGIIDEFPTASAQKQAAVATSYTGIEAQDLISTAAANTYFPDSCYEPLTEVYSQVAAITYHDTANDKYYVLVQNPLGINGTGRNNMAIHIRELDYETGLYAEGSEWITKQIGNANEGYAALTTLANGDIGSFWEFTRDTNYYDMVFQSFTFDYLLGNDQLWPTEITEISGEVIAPNGTTKTYADVGDTIQITVATNTPVYITGTPKLSLNIGGSLGRLGTTISGGSKRFADYVSGSGTNEIIFAYTIQSTDPVGTVAAYAEIVTDSTSTAENAFGYNYSTITPRYKSLATIR